jgi:hypothetical protein
MAAGSILFRPYNTAGFMYGNEAKIDETDPDFLVATAADMLVQPGMTGPTKAVTADYLASLLAQDATEQACVHVENGVRADLVMKSVKDLAGYMMGDGQSLAGGLARHLPRALSNLPSTSEEIIVKVNQAYTDQKGLLAPMMAAYFSSETYACKR